MLTIYFGFPRSGKSTLISQITYQYHHKYPDVKVFSNTATVGAYKINKSQLTSCAIPDGSVILWDEGGIDFNNRKYNDMDQALIRFLKLHGHSKLTILVFSQSWDDVDITLRRLAEYIFYIRRMGQFTMIRSISRFFFMDDQFHEIRSGYRWTPLWYYFFYPFWRIKPIYFMFRPFYYDFFDSYWKDPKPPIPLRPWSYRPLPRKIPNFLKWQKKRVIAWAKGNTLKDWIKYGLLTAFVIAWLSLLFRSCSML